MTIDIFPAWSPDGTKIIYSRERPDYGRPAWQYGGFLHDVTTGRDTCIWPNIVFDGFSWSPDGKRVAYTQDAQVFIYDFENDSTHQITFENQNFSLSWSPCGDKLIFFYRKSGGGLYIYEFAADSIAHLQGRKGAGQGDWMPDCSSLVLMDSCDVRTCAMYGYNIYTDSLWFITDVSGYKRELSVSPDGKTVVFGVDLDLWTVPTAGGSAYRLTEEGGGYPDWSPDGQWIVFTKPDWYNGYLWLMRPDGSDKHQITF